MIAAIHRWWASRAVDPRTWDFTRPRWGHALSRLTQNGDGTFTALGHGPLGYGPPGSVEYIRRGDSLLVAMASGKTGRYLVLHISYFWDPPDMFKATIQFTGYES